MPANDRRFMNMALRHAQKGCGFTSPNPMVGAVVVQKGIVVGRGYHHAAGEPHAEVNALNDAGDLAKSATLYVTLEPCNHKGRTPPCTQKIIRSGIRRVVVAMEDPNAEVRGGGNNWLAARGISVTSGICRREAEKINEVFIKYVTTQRPFVILKCASTLDGRIATRSGDSKWVTGKEARQFVHHLRHSVDAILVGIGTVVSDNPRLTTRLENTRVKDPVRIILDTHLSISEQAAVLGIKSEAKTIIFTGKMVSENKVKRLTERGICICSLPVTQKRLSLRHVLAELKRWEITSVLIEGGAAIMGSALKEGVVDKINFFYAPKILGGDDGVPICRGLGPELMSGSMSVKGINVRRFGSDVMIEGYMDSAG